eukprot:CAMPEP_0197824396 /NCGR_PEP_ID=MMETSP1437-20131217/1647_1 /TAXON_ID=49252 ORGANISM="Eucampia antarctica, Strain CCMP1452" /NCGR_SAMPLE_ID=MMETSP1437 /ASSEMBLY_ACC=CAM_ASM_001096 /LENGTH=334 /DNA_ID=CAMNT_0043424005 /DNA_START=24 /DNA_END=1025 /DNA_ORIENTATION=+
MTMMMMRALRSTALNKYYGNPKLLTHYNKFFLSTYQAPLEPIIDVASFQSALSNHASTMLESLSTQGYYCTSTPYAMLPKETILAMRHQSIDLRSQGRFEQSWSEKIDASGKAMRFDKEGVFACEPDGGDYDTAPDLITYMSLLLQTLPELLNNNNNNNNNNRLSLDDDKSESITESSSSSSSSSLGLSVSSFNAKLAVTMPGSVYPLHIDNPQGLAAGDTRKLTCIIYLNPDYEPGDGGELRILFHGGNNNNDNNGENASSSFADVTPDGGRMVLFWSDEIPHEVMPTTLLGDVSRDRYALTIWIPTDRLETIHNPKSKFATLGDDAFHSKKN